ncbi:MAG: anion permease, partial [Oscillospiraceae bacterium]
FLLIVTLVLLGCMLLMPMKVKTLNGTKEYFERNYAALGPMKRDEKICAALFIFALLAAFARPLYAALLPGLAPAYVFLTVGFISFFIIAADKGSLLTWETAQKETMWGMMLLFAGGMALGKLINGSGASSCIAELVSGLNLDGGFFTIVILVFFIRLIAELTNGTTAAAICLPIVFGFTEKMGLNPIPYWFIAIMAYNGEFLLPISVRAIPIGYGLDANKMLKGGIPMTLISSIIAILFGYICIKFVPSFGNLPYLFN